jgi:hypothetical protein
MSYLEMLQQPCQHLLRKRSKEDLGELDLRHRLTFEEARREDLGHSLPTMPFQGLTLTLLTLRWGRMANPWTVVGEEKLMVKDWADGSGGWCRGHGETGAKVPAKAGMAKWDKMTTEEERCNRDLFLAGSTLCTSRDRWAALGRR